ncbi:AMSH-like ubiquitin thioesterase 2, partial [Dichanthelium oligosanthes]
RYDMNAWRCGTHPTPSKSMYLDAQQVVHCQAAATDHDVGPCAVKHHFPSSIVSWIEDLSSFGNVSFSPDSEYVDEQASASVGHSSTSSNLHDMQISVRLTDEFMELAKENTSSNLETCGILGASFRDGTYFVTTLIIPKQEGTAHSTHPSQTCFLSSIDLHTQYSYQVMLPEAVAIVVAPTDPTRQVFFAHNYNRVTEYLG